jgi:hypothetical protein
MKFLPCVLACLLSLPLLAAEKTPVPRRTNGLPQTGDFVFSLMPKAFQSEPTLEMTVNTEFTSYGRMLRPASPDQPVHYLAVPAGFKPLGAPMGGEKPPPPADLERAMKKALAVNGYLAAEDGGPRPALVVIYYWGSHNALDSETRANFPELDAKNKLERAVLVGGKKYAMETGRAMEWGPGLEERTTEREFLRDQVNEDVYYVVASAYDYNSVARNEKKLAWRTSMTVNAIGVSMSETLAPLIGTASAFFGRETITPQIDVRKVPRKTKVEMGTPTVVEDKVPARKPGRP